MVQYITDSPVLEQYRPPGRSARSGRAQADNDVFEGLPVKQWGQSLSHVSLAPPKSETTNGQDDKWAEPPMPRDYQLLQPWTQHLLRLARSGKVGTKRKPTGDPDSMDEDKAEDELAEDAKANFEDRGYVAKKWKHVPEALLEPEHKHFEFLAKRRKGLPSLYAPAVQGGVVPVPMRKTKVQKAGPDGELAIYEVLVPEGQTVEGEVTETTELADVKPVAAAPGTVIEGVGIANEEGVVVAEHLKSTVAPRRNRPPPKKKGGPGRGKKRVTFTNADGTTYTTVVPNATKIVPQPGQTVKHVAKGEEASADITAEQAAQHAPTSQTNGEGECEGEGEEGEEGQGSDEGDDEGDEDDDREEGELSEDDAQEAGHTPLPQEKNETKETQPEAQSVVKTEDTEMENAPPAPIAESVAPETEESKARDASSSPELPLAKASHSRQNSLVAPQSAVASAEEPPAEVSATEEQSEPAVADEPKQGAEDATAEAPAETEVEKFEDGEEDLLGNLEKSLGGSTDQQAA